MTIVCKMQGKRAVILCPLRRHSLGICGVECIQGDDITGMLEKEFGEQASRVEINELNGSTYPSTAQRDTVVLGRSSDNVIGIGTRNIRERDRPPIIILEVGGEYFISHD